MQLLSKSWMRLRDVFWQRVRVHQSFDVSERLGLFSSQSYQRSLRARLTREADENFHLHQFWEEGLEGLACEP